MRFLKITAFAAAGVIVFYVGACAALIFWPHPDYFAGREFTLEQSRAMETEGGAVLSLDEPFREDSFGTRDGETLFARRYGPGQGPAILFLHGVASDSSALNHAAGLLQRATGAEVITPDLRGHGASTGPRFDADYIGQYEDDLEDLILTLRRENPDRRIFIGGHSMGGGIALRYALKAAAPEVAGYLLFAPNFGDPVRHPPPEPGSEAARAAEAFVQLNGKRLIGQIFLNLVGLHAFDHLPVLYFNKAPEHPAYSYAAIASAQPNPPQDAAVALAAVDAPMVVLAGGWDEAFDASKYAALVRAHSDGETHVVEGLRHNGVLNDPAVHAIVGAWFASL